MGGAIAEAVEGQLVVVEDVVVTQVDDIAGAGGNLIFGAFKVTAGLTVSAEIYRPRGLTVGTALSSITGILRNSSEMCTMPNGDCSCAGMAVENDSRQVGDRFESMTGVVNYSFDVLRLEPRSDADLVRR